MSSKQLSGLTVTTESTGMRQLRVTVDVGEDRVQKAMHDVARRIAREGRIPGFRKGKAPYSLILQRYGEEAIRGEAAEELVNVIYREVLEAEEIEAYGPGGLEEMDLTPLRFAFTIPLWPQVALGDYRALRVKPPKVKVTKEEVGEVLKALQQEHAILTPAKDRAAKKGDTLRASVQGRGEDGAVLIEDESAEIVLDPASEYPTPGFHEALVGMKVDEERTFSLEMTRARPPQQVEFTVHLLELFDRILPGIDDDLARTVGRFDNLKALEKDIRAELLERKEAQAQEEYVEQIIDALLAQATIEYPQVMLDEEIDALVEQVRQRAQRDLHMSLEDYLKVTKKSEDELREELLPQAERRLRRDLLLAEVTEAEGVEVSEEEVEKHLDEISASWGEQAEQIRAGIRGSKEGMNSVRNSLLFDKLIERLIAIARGEAGALKEEEESEGEDK